MEPDEPALPCPADVPWNRWDLLRPMDLEATSGALSVIIGPPDAMHVEDLLRGLSEDPGGDFTVEYLVPSGCGADGLEAVREVDVSSSATAAEYRNAAVDAAQHDVLLFLMAPVEISASFVRHHLRWHASYSDVVVIGLTQTPTTVSGSGPESFRGPDSSGRAELGEGGTSTLGPETAHLLRTRDLTTEHSDLFRYFPVSNVSLRRRTLVSAGGFTTRVGRLEFRHAFDEVLGYRLFQSGHVFVYDQEAVAAHPGLDVMRRVGVPPEATLEILSQHVAHPTFRADGASTARLTSRWRVTIDAKGSDLRSVRRTLGTVLASATRDLVVLVDRCEDDVAPYLDVMAQADPRLQFPSDQEVQGFASLWLHLPAGATIASDTLRLLEQRLEDLSEPVGVLRMTVPEQPPSEVAAVAVHSRAYNRGHRLRPECPFGSAAALFGQRWLSGLDVGISDRGDVAETPPSTGAAAARPSPDDGRELWEALGGIPSEEREQLLQAGLLVLRAPRWLRRLGIRLARILVR